MSANYIEKSWVVSWVTYFNNQLPVGDVRVPLGCV